MNYAELMDDNGKPAKICLLSVDRKEFDILYDAMTAYSEKNKRSTVAKRILKLFDEVPFY